MRWFRELMLLAVWPVLASASPAPVLVLSISGAIGPATSDYVHRGIEHAVELGAQLVVLRMDTPGGLDTSMRAIIQDILAAPMPVAAFVAPAGARAASAGTYILYASHVAAMAPATNLGAATPVRIGGIGAQKDKPAGKPEAGKSGRDGEGDEAPSGQGDTLAHKQVNDAAAYIRSLAQLRGRNPAWAERAVREAVSLSAEEALRDKVVDLVAPDVPHLLAALDGRTFEAAGAGRVLHAAGAEVVDHAPGWRTRFLAAITDPSIAYILILLGAYAIIFELSNPGLVLPGVVGTLSVLVALYAFHLLPVNYAGLALLVAGIGFMVAEAFFPAYGSLGIGGLAGFVIGSIILFDSDTPDLRIPYALVAGFAAASAAFLAMVAAMLLRSRKRPVVSGREELIGCPGEMVEGDAQEPWARVHGELWRVRSKSPLPAGVRVRVTAIEGLVLDVVPDPDYPGGEPC